MTLTDAGEVLLQHANAILGLVEHAHGDFREFERRRAALNAAPRKAPLRVLPRVRTAEDVLLP